MFWNSCFMLSLWPNDGYLNSVMNIWLTQNTEIKHNSWATIGFFKSALIHGDNFSEKTLYLALTGFTYDRRLLRLYCALVLRVEESWCVSSSATGQTEKPVLNIERQGSLKRENCVHVDTRMQLTSSLAITPCAVYWYRPCRKIWTERGVL